MAEAGAKVVVNDLGATLDGQASGEQPAQEVVATIAAAGATHRRRRLGRRVERRAQDGRGGGGALRPHRHRRQQRRILRDVMFHRMSEPEFDQVIAGAPEGRFQRQPRGPRRTSRRRAAVAEMGCW
jgi:hypothetical protein